MFHRLGMISFYGSNFLNNLAELDEDMLPYTKHYFQLFFKNEPSIEIKSGKIWYEERTDFAETSVGTPRISHMDTHGYEVLRGSGIVTGPLLGGCIDSFYDILTGQLYDEEPTGKILFIETSEGRPKPDLFRQLLLKLKSIDTLSAVSAIIVSKPQNESCHDDYKQILIEVTQSLQTPILFNVNFGHGYPRTILQYGINCEIDFTNRTLKPVESWFKD